MKIIMIKTSLTTVILLLLYNTSYAQRWDEWFVDYSWEYEAIFPERYSYDELLSLNDTLIIESLDEFIDENKDKKVVKLQGFSYIPQELVVLKQIEVMDISWCELSVAEFGKLAEHKNLIALNMFHTKKSQSEENAILPEEFGNLDKLKYLRMYNNGISELPESFGNLSSLEVWSFGEQTQLGLPNSIANLKSLKVVEFYRFSERSDFNKNFLQLTQLESMHLSGFLGENENLDDFDWSGFTKLEELEISSKYPNADNPTYIPESIYKLPNLKIIHYSKFDLNKTDFENYKKYNPNIKFKKYK